MAFSQMTPGGLVLLVVLFLMLSILMALPVLCWIGLKTLLMELVASVNSPRCWEWRKPRRLKKLYRWHYYFHIISFSDWYDDLQPIVPRGTSFQTTLF